MADDIKPVSTWRKVFAGIFDFLTIFFVGGYVIGKMTGRAGFGNLNSGISGFSA